MGNFRDVALRHDASRALVLYLLRQGFDDDVTVRVVVANAENLTATHAVERLEDRIALYVDKALDECGFARDHRRHGEPGEFANGQLFGVIA